MALNLPKTNGADVIRALKEQSPDAVKIIVASGYLELQMNHSFCKRGIRDYIHKPY